MTYFSVSALVSRTVTQAVSRQLPATVAQVESQAGHVGFMVGRMVRGGKFSASTSFSSAISHPTDCSAFINYHWCYAVLKLTALLDNQL